MRNSDPSIVRGPETEVGRECYYCWDGEVNLFRADSTSKPVINASGYNRRAIVYIVYDECQAKARAAPEFEFHTCILTASILLNRLATTIALAVSPTPAIRSSGTDGP
jgi:hypothetical protein